MDPTTGLVDDHNTPWYIRGGWLLAHELGHVTGLAHVACTGSEGGVDQDYPYPYPNCSLAEVNPQGFYGFDVYYDLFGLSEPTVISNNPSAAEPNLGFPLMGYKFPKYVDDYTYCKLLNHFGVPCDLYGETGGGGGSGGTGPTADCKPCAGNPLCNKGGSGLGIQQFQLELCISDDTLPEPMVFPSDPEAFLMVTGEVQVEPAQATITKVYALSSQVFDGTEAWEGLREALLTAEEPTPFWLDLLDGEGRVLTSVPIVQMANPHEPTDTIGFLYTLPATKTIQAVVIRTLDGAERARAPASANAPSVRITDIAAGAGATEPITVAWQAEDADEDPLDFIVQVSSDGGEQWETLALGLTERQYVIDPMSGIPGGDQPLVRVIASDGFNTASDIQPLPQPIPGKPPLALILGPVDGAIFPTNGLVVLSGTASDLEDGGLPPAALAWSSDLDGPLGTGPEISTFDLSPGRHVITLRATDSDGQVAEAQIRLAIDPNVVRARPDPAQVAAAERILREGLPAQPPPQDTMETPGQTVPAVAWQMLAGLAVAAAVGLGLLAMALRRR